MMDSTAIESRIHHHQPLSATSSAFQTSGANPSLLLTPVNNAPRSLYHGNQSLLLPNLAPFSPNYTQLLASAFPGPGFEGIDLDAMKVSNWIRRSQPYQRALDTTSLPPNPKNGQVPHIDPSSSFDNLPLKRARVSPAFGTHSPHSPKVTLGPEPFTPGFISSFGYMQNAAAPQSPLNLGGPLSTPAQTPNMGAHVANGMNVPQSPSMGMINGMMGMGGFSMVNFPFNMNMAYPGSPIMSRSMNPHTMTGNYGPAAAAAAAAAAGNTTGRTVYVGNLPAEASVDDLLNLVRFGPIEGVRLLGEKSCVFISFLDGSTAAAFHADASVKKLALHGQELRIGWGKPSTVPTNVSQAVSQHQATRNVFLGNLAETTNEQVLRNELSKFGPIDQIKIVRDKNIGFVHFLSISTAMKQLPNDPAWQDKRINYGKDRCAYVPKAQQAAVQAAQAQAAAAISAQHAQLPGSPFVPFSPMTPSFASFGTPASGFGSPIFTGGGGFSAVAGGYMDPASAGQAGNRNIYLGNLGPDTTTEELCNNIRGGMLQQVRHLHDKNIAFVTFLDAACALAFYQHATMTNLTINSRRLKIGWGKHSGPVIPALLQAVQVGASRNVYIGSISDFVTFNEEKLREDFGEYGDIEMINFLREKNAAFVNFTTIQSAQKAVDGIKLKPEYSTMRISYGKDRCANLPRASNTPGPRSTMQRADSVQNGLKEADAPPVYDQPEYIDEDLNDGPASFE